VPELIDIATILIGHLVSSVQLYKNDMAPPKWLDEQVVEHKFDYIQIEEYRTDSIWTRLSWIGLHFKALIVVLRISADIAALIFLFWGGKSVLGSGDAVISPEITKWLYLFLLLAAIAFNAVQIKKARAVIRTHEISLSYITYGAYWTYSTSNYAYFCLFKKIDQMKRWSDRIALFVFFMLRQWLRIIVVDSPRNIINILTLIDVYQKTHSVNPADYPWLAYGALVLIALSTGIFLLNATKFFLAMLSYLPLVCIVRGNLKEYCRHKIDKRYAAYI
jgi:hypothetical protein